MTKNWQLFRYKAVNEYLWQELEFSEFYCGSPSSLNDPFDCRVDWRQALQRALSAQTLPSRRTRLQQMLAAFEEKSPFLDAGICCFSIKLDDHLMWSHYANSHRGVCLFYEIPASYFQERYPPKNQPDGSTEGLFFVGGSEVFYDDNAFHDWLLAGEHQQPLPGHHIENAVSRIFSSKAKIWSHEEEFRIVTSKPGFIGFDQTFLKQVTFGFAMEPRHKLLIERMAKRSNSDVVLSEVQRSGASDFGLIFPEIAGWSR